MKLQVYFLHRILFAYVILSRAWHRFRAARSSHFTLCTLPDPMPTQPTPLKMKPCDRSSMAIILRLLAFATWLVACQALPAQGAPEVLNISRSLFESLEELARIVDISYCVGSSGIQKPFSCLSRCKEFEGFELVTVCSLDGIWSSIATNERR